MTDQQQENNHEYQVLARKYRPSTFHDLIGQDALVRTLSNAIDTGRLVHSFMLTGIRGVGKTTTARLIAKSLNCIGEDGKGKITIDPCGVCEHCTSISKGQNVDVLEIDAASNTGIDNIRSILDDTSYSTASARFKIYVIDEVHMLSTSSFNALLKTLEEPPAHVKFILATTDIQKVPVTVLSRCQCFDLRRIEVPTLKKHFESILQKEDIPFEEQAINMIAQSSDGSVRDGLSLLDQAISYGANNVTEEVVMNMLGAIDRRIIIEIFKKLSSGEISQVLEMVNAQYAQGISPIVVIRDLLIVIHWLTKIKVSPQLAGENIPSGMDLEKGQEISNKINIAELARLWQMLLKSLQDVNSAPNQLQALEMALITISYASTLPTSEQLAKMIQVKQGDTKKGE